MSHEERGSGAHLLSFGPEPTGGLDEPTKSVKHSQCDARPKLTLPAAGHCRSVIASNLYCLVTEARVCEQHGQGVICYLLSESARRG